MRNNQTPWERHISEYIYKKKKIELILIIYLVCLFVCLFYWLQLFTNLYKYYVTVITDKQNGKNENDDMLSLGLTNLHIGCWKHTKKTKEQLKN